MAVSMEALQAMMSELQRMNNDNLKMIMSQQLEAFNTVFGFSQQCRSDDRHKRHWEASDLQG